MHNFGDGISDDLPIVEGLSAAGTPPLQSFVPTSIL
jgi:hypothetical protein